MPRLPRVTGREVARVLERHGYELSRTRGSHHIYRHRDSDRPVVVPVHANRVIPPGTLLNIIKQVGIDVTTFIAWLKN